MISTMFSFGFLSLRHFSAIHLFAFFSLKNKIFSLSHSLLHTLFSSPSHIHSHTFSLPLTLTQSQKHIDHARVPSVQISCFSEPCSPLTRRTSVTPSTTTSGKWTSPLLTRRRQTFFWEDDKGCRINRVTHTECIRDLDWTLIKVARSLFSFTL